MPLQLLSLEGGPSILLDKPILLLGRHQECDIQIDSRKISRRHCCIAQVNDTLMIRDLDSTNGIRVNGERVQEARLALGDEVVIGNSRFRVATEAEGIRGLQPRRNPADRRAAPAVKNPADHTYDEDSLLESSEVPVAIDESSDRSCAEEQLDSGETYAAEGSILPKDLHLAPSVIQPRPRSRD